MTIQQEAQAQIDKQKRDKLVGAMVVCLKRIDETLKVLADLELMKSELASGDTKRFDSQYVHAQNAPYGNFQQRSMQP
jgi:hypothetical protein